MDAIGLHINQLVDGSWEAHAFEHGVFGYGDTREAAASHAREQVTITVAPLIEIDTATAGIQITGTF